MAAFCDGAVTHSLCPLRRKRALVRTDAVPRATEDQKLFTKMWIHAPRHLIINTGSEEGTGKFRMGRGHWVGDVCYYLSEL